MRALQASHVLMVNNQIRWTSHSNSCVLQMLHVWAVNGNFTILNMHLVTCGTVTMVSNVERGIDEVREERLRRGREWILVFKLFWDKYHNQNIYSDCSLQWFTEISWMKLRLKTNLIDAISMKDKIAICDAWSF